MKQLYFGQAMNEAFMEEMTRDDNVFYMGECVVCGGAMGITQGIFDKFGKERIRETGLIEDTLLNAGVGAALAGYRPIIDPMFCDFMTAGFPGLNNAARWRFIHGGKPTIPLVIVAAMGGYIGIGPEHSQSLEGLVMHTPGLKLVIPTTPYDAKGLMKTAIRDNNPVVYYYHKRLLMQNGPVPEEEYTIPFGVADIKREGKDVTVVAIGYMVALSLDVAKQLEEKGISVEVVDPRTLVPLDMDTIVASVKKTKRVVIVDEDYLRCGVTGEIGMQIMEKAFDYLDAPIQRIGTTMWIPSGAAERLVLPQPQNIADAIRAVMGIKESLTVKGLGGPGFS